jgi:hypothetical protein
VPIRYALLDARANFIEIVCSGWERPGEQGPAPREGNWQSGDGVPHG